MRPDGLVTLELDIWKLGVPLRDAPYAFAPDHLRTAYDGAQISAAEPFLAPIAEIVLAISNNNNTERDPKRLDMAQQIQKSKDRTDAYFAAVVEMRERLRSGIQLGAFVAYGYAIPRDPNSRRIKIPADVFEEKYTNWNNSAIKGAGLEFVSVLVFESGTAQAIDAQLAKKSSQGTELKRGPSPSKAAIKEAIQSLIEQGRLPNHNQQKENVGLIRERIHELHPGEFPHDRGLGHESIRNVLSQLVPHNRN
jgi:hypothetical protein